jgi:molybdopterin converting factor small subunit
MDRIRVRLFAGARESINLETIDVELQLPATVHHLKEAIAIQFEPIRPFVEFGRIALNNEFADDSEVIDSKIAQSAIALIPPVSGG